MFESMKHFTDMTGQLDAIGPVSSALLREGDQTDSRDLVSVLQEVEKTLTAVELTLIQFLSLRFEDRREDDLRTMTHLQGGEPAKLIGEMRARCSRIGDLYRNSLRAWFDRAQISDQQRDDLARLFASLEESDSNVIKPAVAEMIRWLQVNVDAVANYVREGKFKEARERVDGAAAEVVSIRRDMGTVASNFRELELYFTPASADRS